MLVKICRVFELPIAQKMVGGAAERLLVFAGAVMYVAPRIGGCWKQSHGVQVSGRGVVDGAWVAELRRLGSGKAELKSRGGSGNC